MKNKKIVFVAAALAVFLFCAPLKAQLKADGGAAGARTLGAVETFVEQTLKRVNAAAKKVTESKIGQSLKTTYEKAQALKQRIQKDINTGKELYEGAKGVYDDAHSLYTQGTETYEQQMEKLKNSQAVSTVSLKKQLDEIDANLEARKVSAAQELNARLEDAQKNEKILQELYDAEEYEDTKASIAEQLAETKALKEEYEKALNTMGDKGNSYLDSDEQYQALLAQKQDTQQKYDAAKTALETSAKGLAASIVKGMVKKSPEDKKAAYSDGIAKNYILPDEPMNQAAIDRIQNERRENVKKDMANALVQLIGVRQKMAALDQKKDDLANNIEAVDYEVTALALQNQQRIQELDLLTEEIKLEAAKQRLKTSRYMQNRDFRVQNPEKNPAEINMDNYVLTEDDVKKAGIGN